MDHATQHQDVERIQIMKITNPQAEKLLLGVNKIQFY